MSATQPAMPLQPTAEVSEDGEELAERTADATPMREESTHTLTLRLVAENTLLRLEILRLNDELRAALSKVDVLIT